MVFNTVSNIPTWTDPQDDIVSDCYFWTGANSISYKIADIVRNANRALDKLVTLLQRSDGRWKWQDTNKSTVPFFTDSLVANQEDYNISATPSKIHHIRIKDTAGNWVTLDVVDRSELNDAQLTATAGDPRRCYFIGTQIYLNPKPNYASSEGLEIYAQEGASYFATTDTTKEPGIPTQFHRLVSLYTSRDYGFLNSRKQQGESLIKELENELLIFMSQRLGAELDNISLQKTDYGEIGLDDTGWSSHPDRF